MYIYCDTYDDLDDLRNTAYWIVINEIPIETAKGYLYFRTLYIFY